MKLKMAADQVLKRFSRQIRKEDASRTKRKDSWWGTYIRTLQTVLASSSRILRGRAFKSGFHQLLRLHLLAARMARGKRFARETNLIGLGSQVDGGTEIIFKAFRSLNRASDFLTVEVVPTLTRCARRPLSPIN